MGERPVQDFKILLRRLFGKAGMTMQSEWTRGKEKNALPTWRCYNRSAPAGAPERPTVM